MEENIVEEAEDDDLENEITITRNGESYKLSDRRIRELASKFIEMASDEAAIHEDFGMSIKMIDVLTKVKSAFFPATQKNLNLNVQNFDNKLQKFMEARKEMEKAREEGLTIFDIKDIKDEDTKSESNSGRLEARQETN